MTLPPGDLRPYTRRRFVLPKSIFVSVHIEKPATRRLDNARAMLRHPGFWAVMLALTVLMFIGALVLSDYLRTTMEHPAQNTSRVYYTLSR